jgi:cytoskeletal protein CcmA (bactofilin family)
MFFKKSSNDIQSTIDTLIGSETSINGDLEFSGGLRIDGELRGNITESNMNPSTLILSEHGKVEGAISASKLVLNGNVIGPVKASQFIELQNKAHITGDVYYKSLEMHTGAVVEGRLVYTGEAADDGDIEVSP